MTFSATGSGTIAYRLVIDGCPYEAVTLAEMEREPVIGADWVSYAAARYDGLIMRDTRFSAKADPVQCKLEVGGIEFKIVDVAQRWSRLFDLPATATTWLTGDVSSLASSMPVASTTGFESGGGLIWIDGEAMSYSGVDATHFTGCTRGLLSPDADAASYHYTSDGIRLRNPEVTNWPVLWEGRRVYVYRYDEGDSLTGNGTQIYRGVITTAPRFDGTTWTIGVDSIVTILEQTFGEDLAVPLQPRGIHYPDTAPLYIQWEQWPTGSIGSAVFGSVSLSGQWENQEDFCDDLSTALGQSLTDFGGTGTFTAVSEGSGGWHIKYTTAATAKQCRIRVTSPIDPPLGCSEGPLHPSVPGAALVPPGLYGTLQKYNTDPIGDFTGGGALSASTDYYFYRPCINGVFQDEPRGSVPRGIWAWPGSTDSMTIYLDSATPIPDTANCIVATGTDPAGVEYSDIYEAASIDSATRSLVITPHSPSATRSFVNNDGLPSFRIGLLLQTTEFPLATSIAGVLNFITTNQQQFSPLGILPSLRLDDWYDNTSNDWHVIISAKPPIVSSRIFVTFSPTSLGDLVREELKAAGCFLGIDSTGRLKPVELALPASSQAASVATIDADTLLTDKARVAHEVSGLGQVNQVVYKDGYDPVADDWTGDTFTVRDVSAFGQSSQSRPQQIEQRSQYVGGTPVTQADVVNLAAPILGALSGSYAIDTIDASKSDPVQVGEPIIFDCPYLITGDGAIDADQYPTGSIGALGRVGQVIGKEWGAYSPRVRFTVLNTKQRVAGYAPAGLITAQAEGGGGNWTLTIDPSLFPTGTTAEDFWAVGDYARIAKFNNATSGYVDGTVLAVTGNSVNMIVTWTPGASTWYLTIPSGGGLVTTQYRYCIVANSSGIINSGGANQQPAKVFAP